MGRPKVFKQQEKHVNMSVLSSIKKSDLLSVRSLIRVVVALALIGLIISYPGALVSPYQDTGLDGYYDNQIVEQASDVESIEHSTVTDQTPVYQYSELSPVGKEVFDKTKSDEENTFTINLCKDWVLTCDAYYESDIPDDFQYGAVGHNVDESELYAVIEYEGEAYVLQTGALWHADGWAVMRGLHILASSLMVLVVSGVLIHNAIRPPERSNNGFGFWDVVIASLIGIFAFAVPYLHMWDVFPANFSRSLLIVAVALGVPVYYLGIR